MTGFTLRGAITNVEQIASRRGIRSFRLLQRLYGRGNWRKLKGQALVELANGQVVVAELHWYEAHGIGRVGMKVKRLLE